MQAANISKTLNVAFAEKAQTKTTNTTPRPNIPKNRKGKTQQQFVVAAEKYKWVQIPGAAVTFLICES